MARRPKAKFKVGQVVKVKTANPPILFQIVSKAYDSHGNKCSGWWYITNSRPGVEDGELSWHQSELRFLTSREKGN